VIDGENDVAPADVPASPPAPGATLAAAKPQHGPSEWSPPRPASPGATVAEPAAPAHARADSSGSTVIAVLGLMLLVLSAMVAGLVAFVMDGDDDVEFSANRPSEDYALEEMALRVSDVPSGMTLGDRLQLDNEQWAIAIDQVDPESRIPQLEAQGRIRNQVSVFGWSDSTTAKFGQMFQLLSQSTLYETEAQAQEAIAGAALCGLRLDDTSPIDEFSVPRVGDESVGFFVTMTDESLGRSVETVVCFRTGRIVHGVVQSSFDGAQDIALVVGLARKMFDRTEAWFDGSGAAPDEDPDPET
jgi:hypothetical protein